MGKDSGNSRNGKTTETVKTVAEDVFLEITLEGYKELLGLRIGDQEGSKFWLNLLTELEMECLE